MACVQLPSDFRKTGDIKSALWTVRNQAESLTLEKRITESYLEKNKKLVNLLSRILLKTEAKKEE